MYAQINEHRNYLNQTDYKVIKEAETEYTMPIELKDARQHARDEINRISYEVEKMEELMADSAEEMDIGIEEL